MTSHCSSTISFQVEDVMEGNEDNGIDDEERGVEQSLLQEGVQNEHIELAEIEQSLQE
ncbi:MAG: hypothetical protein GY874_15020, partial [Desulfobacteraceae bacterium]|nr:hypothetical protein [Desulfobacteraceae bacterium]